MKKTVSYCEFQEWDREHNCMGHCKELATHKVGAAKLCLEHAKYSMSLRMNQSRSPLNMVALS